MSKDEEILRKYALWLRGKAGRPFRRLRLTEPCLSDLRGADLRGADLRGANGMAEMRKARHD